MLDHIAGTYLSRKYQETRDWHGFVRQRVMVGSISRWITELSDIQGVCVPIHLGRIAREARTSALQELFAERSPGGERQARESLAKQVVDFLVLACLEAFPDFFESLGLPRTAEELERVTSYELAVAVFSRWHTEEEFVHELTMRTRSVSPKWKRSLLQFCTQAILYMFNILIMREYRQLFIEETHDET
jgi:hypothetical protein